MRKIPLRTSLILMTVTILLGSIALLSYLSINTARDTLDKSKGDYAMSIAKIVADMPEIKQAFYTENPETIIQPIAENIRNKTDAEFIVVMNMDSIRYSHSNPNLIGKTFTGGDEGNAKNGNYYVSRAKGISGPSLRAFVPIFDRGKQIGVVAVGFFDDNLQKSLAGMTNPIRTATLISLLIGIIGSYIISGLIKRDIFGLEPFEIAKILKERQAMIESMRDGIIAVNTKGKITVINNEAKRILGIPEDTNVIGQAVDKYIPNTRLNVIMKTGQPEFDKEQILNKSMVITNRVPIIVDNEVVGAMAFFRDKTELYQLAEELTGVKKYSEALRARSHEFLNKLQTVSGLIELGQIDKALSTISSTTEIQQEQMSVLLRQIKYPEIVGILLGKMGEAKEENIELIVSSNSYIDHILPFYFSENDMITVVGNLLQNSIESFKGLKEIKKKIILTIQYDKDILIKVSDNGCGIPENIKDKIFQKGFTTKESGSGIGLYLVKNIVESAKGQINIVSTMRGSTFIIKIPGESESRYGGN